MKAYTDIEQSKKLAEMLPLESADMCYGVYDDTYNNLPWLRPYHKYTAKEFYLPCWSLAALLSVLPFQLIVNNQRYAFSMIKGLNKNGETYAIKYAIFNTTFYLHLTDFYNNPIDACYESILKLHDSDYKWDSEKKEL